MKKIICMVMVIALLLGMSCFSAFAANGPFIPIEPGYMGARLFVHDYNSDASAYILKCDEGAVVDNNVVEGASYDLASNTLTLTDYDHSDLDLVGYYMGDDFTLNVVGTCRLGSIRLWNMYAEHSTGLTITGTGTLYVNEVIDDPKADDTAITISNEGHSAAKLQIEGDVTVHLYGQRSVFLRGTEITDKDQAITAGGKPVAGVTGEELTYTDYDWVHLITYSTYDEAYSRGYRLYAKDDPDAIYTASASWDKKYWVERYVYYPEYDDYGMDLTFESENLTEEELLEKYEFVLESQPTEAPYYSQKQYEERGQLGYRMVSADDPDGVYVGVESWNWDSDTSGDPDGYDVYRVEWDEDQEYYVRDSSFESDYILAEDVDNSSYSFVTEAVEKNKTIFCWVMPLTAENQDDNYESSFEVVQKADDPDTLYVCEPYWFDYNDDAPPEGWYIYPVHTDEETGDYYADTYDFDENTDFRFTAEEFPTSGFSFVRETLDERVDLHFIRDKEDNPADNAYSIVLLNKADEPDAAYGYYPNRTYYYGDDTERYDVYKLTYNETLGIWFSEDKSLGVMSLDEMESAGYKVKYSDQPVDYYTKGEVNFDYAEVYTDDDGARYAYNYYGIYSYDDSKKITDADGTDYYFGELRNDLSREDLHSTERLVHTGRYNYQINGEFHYPAGSAPGGGYTVSGSFTSYLNTAGITVELLQDGAQKYTASYQDDAGDYSLTNVAAGDYTLRVSKKNHVTRDYEITVSGNLTQNVKIYPIGDISGDGKITTKDYAMANAHAMKKTELSGYPLACGDVLKNDGKVTTADAARINAAAMKVSPLW